MLNCRQIPFVLVSNAINTIKMKERVALIIGSTGLIGSHTLQNLIQNDSFTQVISISRKPLKVNHKKLKEIIIDFDKLDTVELNTPIDAAFCCLGTTMKKAGSKEAFYKVDFTYCINFGKLALQNGVKSFQIISSMGANADSLFYYNQVKGKMENELANMNFPTLNILQPSLLLGERSETRVGEDFGKIMNQVFSPFIPKKYKGIEGRKVANFMMQKAMDTTLSGVNRFTSDQMQ